MLRSLQSRLIARLIAVFALATVAGLAVVMIQGKDIAIKLGADEMEERAREVTRFVARDADGKLVLELPERVAQRYKSPARTRMLAIRAPDGTLIDTTDPAFAAEAARHPAQRRRPQSFVLERFGPQREDYRCITVIVRTEFGPVSTSVAAVSDAEDLAEALIDSFTTEVAIAIPLFAIAMLAVAMWTIRRGLRPVTELSRTAAAIGPVPSGMRLPETGLPSELVPLVAAVNGAIDRLEQGVVVQQQFTANAAHALRTPLTILTAGLDVLPDEPSILKLREDALRMNRLVQQLLRVARLDGVRLELSRVDVREIAAQVVANLTPVAIDAQRRLGFDAPAGPIWVQGNAHAIAEALQNVVENALQHTRPDTEVTVIVNAEGVVDVADEGEGIAPADRDNVFKRFWRAPHVTRNGAGLGLAIVAEIMRAHHGTVSVREAPGGGAQIRLVFTAAREAASSGGITP